MSNKHPAGKMEPIRINQASLSREEATTWSRTVAASFINHHSLIECVQP